ncbi:MAG: hypothetical protein LBT76_04885 [Tannerella sp.]|nr:hypothetical protein [Tannerella sp.]
MEDLSGRRPETIIPENIPSAGPGGKPYPSCGTVNRYRSEVENPPLNP